MHSFLLSIDTLSFPSLRNMGQCMHTSLFSLSTLLPASFTQNAFIQNILSPDNLSQNRILLIFCVAGLAGYFISYIKKRPTALFSIIGRGAAGLSFIYFFNFFCAARDIVTGIGINPITGTICTILGIPGAILLYAIRIYSFL